MGEPPEPPPTNGLIRRSRAVAAWVFMFLIAAIVATGIMDHEYDIPDSVLLTLTGALLLMLGIQAGANWLGRNK